MCCSVRMGQGEGTGDKEDNFIEPFPKAPAIYHLGVETHLVSYYYGERST